MTPQKVGAIAPYSRLSESGFNSEPYFAVTVDFANKPVGLHIYACWDMTRPNTPTFSIGSFNKIHRVDGFAL